ncbi:GNAT family N-acetyltransferase [Nocardioides stalactiti]|uniref:GNAT family N-acetyltransferase n=1 Tax=Nocardioides stalactiti TaxID=2755356 RepID=UPI001600234E|nr:GNAT family N-acetyltransferase [Nocardioides stalactiti]
MDIRFASFAELTAVEVHDLARLRQDVFVVEQGCPYPDLDGRDTEPGTAHALLTDGIDLLGYLRVLDEGAEWRIGRVVLARAGRGRGLADGMMTAALAHCAAVDPDRDVVLAAQSPLAHWYAGFGFVPDGEEFLDDGIPHLPMRLVRR